MALYVIEYLNEEGRLFSGPYVSADSWEEAEEKCPEGHWVAGELVHVEYIDENAEWYKNLVAKNEEDKDGQTKKA